MAFLKEGKMEDYVEVLYSGLKRIAEPFEEVWVRTSDIRSDEFRHLEGSSKEIEGNPMLGDHGVRFSLKHPEIMKAEISAIKKVALDFPAKKIGIMMPQVINVNELKETKKIAAEVDVPINVRIGIMVETPAAVQIINDLCQEGISFISFGTNDLTQYILAIDRNNSEVQYLYDEMNPAVLSAISYVIRRCKKFHVETSICGQAGSRPEMAKFLVEQGIDSVSVNADAAEKVSQLIAEVEKGEKVEVLGEKKEDEIEVPKPSEPAEVEEKPTREIEPIFEKEEPKDESEVKLDPEFEKLKELNEEKGESKDIEEIILKELESDEYNPGMQDDRGKAGIPSLNDAIPVDADIFDKMDAKEKNILEELKIE
jgi:hypothetical protein